MRYEKFRGWLYAAINALAKEEKTTMGYLTKSRWQSKTVWLGIATSVLSILGIFAGEKWIMEYPRIASGIGLTIGILTVVVRHFTSVPLMKGPPKP